MLAVLGEIFSFVTGKGNIGNMKIRPSYERKYMDVFSQERADRQIDCFGDDGGSRILKVKRKEKLRVVGSNCKFGMTVFRLKKVGSYV